MARENDWETDGDDWGDEDWPDDDDSAELVPCPNCGREIYEEAEQCPSCGEYVTHDNRILASKPGWYVLLALAGVIAVILALAGLAAW